MHLYIKSKHLNEGSVLTIESSSRCFIVKLVAVWQYKKKKKKGNL